MLKVSPSSKILKSKRYKPSDQIVSQKPPNHIRIRESTFTLKSEDTRAYTYERSGI